MKVLRETLIAWLRASRSSSHELKRKGEQLNRLRLWLLFATLACALYGFALAQTNPPSGETKPAGEKTDTNSPAATAAPAPPASAEKSAATAEADSTSKTNKTDEIQLSFQGANVDMIVQWLAQTTGKTVIKHPQVQCQLNITSYKKVTTREAIDQVYRALSLEGFSAVESANSIFLVPEGKEPKMNPELLDPARKDIPEGRQRLVKIFSLAHIQAADLREKLRSVLSEKGTIDIDDRANQLIVTDYNDNLRLLAELIREFDVTASDSVIQIYTLKHADADELGNLLNLILNSQTSGGGGSSRSSGGGGGSGGGGPSRPPGMPSIGGPMADPGGSGSSPPPSSGGSGATQAVKIWPDRSANRLIVSAAKSRLVELERLLDILDVDKPEDMTVRVLPLKNVTAVELVKDLGPLYQKLGGKTGKEMVDIAASDRANSLIVLSSESNFKGIEKLVLSLDTEDAMEKVVRNFPLKNADAEDVARQLQDLNKDQDSSSRYPYYFFSSSQQNKGTRKMSVVADRRRNSLIVQAPPAQMEGIAKMIEELDAPVGDDSLAPRIYRLKYVSATDIEDVLNELFLKKTQQRSYFDYFNEFQEPTADRDVGRLYGKVRITSEPYSNTIIVTSNSKESLQAVEEVLRQLDAPSEAGESTMRVGLRFAKAYTVANSINILFAKNGSPQVNARVQPGQQGQQQQQQVQQQTGTSSQTGFDLEQEAKEEGYYPWLGGPPDNTRTAEGRSATRPVSDLVGRVRAVADLRSNALLISANIHFFPQVLKLIEDLDAPTDQVLIEARLVEVSSDFLDKLGVRWSPDGSKVFTADDYDNSLLAHVNSQYIKGFGGLTAVNQPTLGNVPGGTTVSQALTALRSGVLESTISMDFLIQFLRKTTAARVLAEPQINIRDNETGRLFVGQQVPTLTANVAPALGGTTQNFLYKDVGVILEVTPHINSSGDVELKIHAESSTVVPGVTVLGGAVFDTRNFRTDLTAKNGQTLVLGGIIQKQVSDTLHKTPILGDIPGLRYLFNKKDKDSHEVELMVFMRPRVTRSPEDAQDLLNEIYKQAPNVKKWKDELHPPQPKEKDFLKESSGNETD